MKPNQQNLDPERLCRQVYDLAKGTGEFIRKEVDRLQHHQIESKGIHNFVTYVDKTAEKQLVEGLQKLLPEAGFIVEENTIDKQGESLQWVVDPLDGTTNFIHGVPVFSISIALMKDKEILLGVVYEINQDECFWAVKGKGAFLNDEPIRVSEAPTVNDSLLATGFPYYDYSRLDQYMKLFTWCLRNSHGVRRMGSAAVDLAYVACGRFDGFFEYSLSPWDVAAGALIVREAGGLVTDFCGGDNPVFGREIIATNPLIFDELLDKVREAFK
ncbi:MAG: inositol monophosphatase family protein [Bacteroides sp.]|jgi:myo-inositol-1(or 4)-monophosphatase|nr:inositol monophosphatase family protein [Bacteroides sp.]